MPPFYLMSHSMAHVVSFAFTILYGKIGLAQQKKARTQNELPGQVHANPN